MAKPDDDTDAKKGEDASGSMGLSMCHNCPGRFWGVWGAANIPWAVKRVTRAIFARKSAETAGGSLAHPWASENWGFTAFADNAAQLANEFNKLLRHDDFSNDVARHIHAESWEFVGGLLRVQAGL